MGAGNSFPDPIADLPISTAPSTQSVVLAGNCFWCIEAVYRQLDGILRVTSGYAGGTKETANYRSVCSGTTDHAESVKIEFDASKVSYGQFNRMDVSGKGLIRSRR